MANILDNALLKKAFRGRRGRASAQDRVAKPLCPKDDNGYRDRALRMGGDRKPI